MKIETRPRERAEPVRGALLAGAWIGTGVLLAALSRLPFVWPACHFREWTGIPCLTCRDTTERPITITEGTNRLVPIPEMSTFVDQALANDWPTGRRPELWDGKAAGRCVESLKAHLHKQ